MKKMAFVFMTLILMFSIAGVASAAAMEDSLELEKKEAEYSGAASESVMEVAPDLMGLLNDWEANGYPDDVGGVYYDEATGNMVIMLVNASETRKQELLSMERYLDSAHISFGESRYSYNEMLAVQKKIEAEMGGGNQKIYSIGVGWTVVDGNETGFGASGKEFRIVVTVDESALDEYAKTYGNLYGDMVYVEPGEAPFPADGDGRLSENANTWLLPTIIAAFILAAFTVIFLSRHPMIPAMQTTAGTTITAKHRMSRQEVVRAVKENAVSPPDAMRETLMKKLDH